MIKRTLLLFGVFLLMSLPSFAGPVSSFGDILFWVGEIDDENSKAALAIDWKVGGETKTLTWGYQWSGTATSEDMFLAVVATDPRLFGRMGSLGGLAIVYGIGYDASGDGQFSLDDESVAFDATGIALTGASNTAESTDALDYYREGWKIDSFWRHGTNDVYSPNSADWNNGPGLSSRILKNGDWDSLAFTTSPALGNMTVAEDLISSESFTITGDYNRNGFVDAADYVVWRDSLGQNVALTGYGADGNRNGFVDSTDYAEWANSFGNSMSSISATVSVPEPSTFFQFIFLCVSCLRGIGNYE